MFVRRNYIYNKTLDCWTILYIAFGHFHFNTNGVYFFVKKENYFTMKNEFGNNNVVAEIRACMLDPAGPLGSWTRREETAGGSSPSEFAALPVSSRSRPMAVCARSSSPPFCSYVQGLPKQGHGSRPG